MGLVLTFGLGFEILFIAAAFIVADAAIVVAAVADNNVAVAAAIM